AQVGAGGGGQAPQPVRGAHWRAGLRAASRSNTIMSAIKTVRVRVVGLIFLLPSNTVSTAIHNFSNSNLAKTGNLCYIVAIVRKRRRAWRGAAGDKAKGEGRKILIWKSL